MKNQALSDKQLLEYSGEHLLYELQMLSYATAELATISEPGLRTSSLIETFGIHLRNLIDFFFASPGGEKPDDVIAPDFDSNWKENLSQTLKDAKERANKELSHLTLLRKNANDPSKPWNVNALFQEIANLVKKFAGQAPSSKLNPDVGKWASQATVPGVLGVGGPVVANNSTSQMTTTAFVSTATITGTKSLSGNHANWVPRPSSAWAGILN
jgi:hypothetical protein